MKTIFIAILLLFVSFSTREATNKVAFDWWKVEEKKADLTVEQRIIKVLSDSGVSVRMQQILLAQAKYESGSFKNALTKKWNNVYSMLHAPKDPYSLGNWGYAEGRSGYAVYRSLEESVSARLWYSRRWKYPKDTTVVAYVSHIKSKGYFTGNARDYLDGLQALIKRDSVLWQ